MASQAHRHYFFHIGLALYIIILFFGSLHPITSWQWPDLSSWFGSFEKETRYTPQNDLIINFLIYIPLGILASITARNRLQSWHLFLTVIISLSLFSLTIEFLQLFVPSRAQSFVDFGMNSAGATAGALIYTLFTHQNSLGSVLTKLRYALFYRGRYIDFGLLTLLAWSLAELNPFLPSLNLSDIFQEINSFNLVNGLSPISLPGLLGFTLESFAILTIISVCIRVNHNLVLVTLTFILLVMLLKFPIRGITALPEEFIGLVISAFVYFALSKKMRSTKILLAIYAVIFSYIISQLNHPPLTANQPLKALNWIPFYFQFNRINHIQETLETIWAISSLCFLFINLQINNYRITVLTGAVIIAMISFTIEWQQQYLIHSSPDITNVLVAIIVWIVPFMHPQIRSSHKSQPLP